jgi:hypothetical protein
MLVALSLLLALAAPAPGGQQVDPSIADGSAQRALDAAKRTWHREGPPSYTYRLQLTCFCNPEVHTFVVRNRRAVNPRKGTRATNTGWKLFKLVQHAIDHRVDGLEVEYRRNGLLKTLSVDQFMPAADDEYQYSVNRYRRLR